jgi:probable F420-dependent oxidoreductase
MTAQHPFRFGVVLTTTKSHTELIERAKKLEDQGYNILLLPDHLAGPNHGFAGAYLSPAVALMAVAAATTHLRIGSFVFSNDFRPPAILAKDVATLDLLSNGRVEMGIGAGYLPEDYAQAGITFERAGVRIERLEEALQIIKQFFSEEKVTFVGKHYTVRDLSTLPQAIQRPHPPIYIGGGGKRVLTLAAREANIIGLTAMTKPTGEFDFSTISAQATRQKIAWIRQAGEQRLSDVEINAFVFLINLTEHRTTVAERMANRLGLTVQDILKSPHSLIGTTEEICNELLERRSEYGISYITIPFSHAEAFAPIVARLTNQ